MVGVHTSSLCKITGMQARQNAGRTWVTLAVGGVREAAGIKSVAGYIGHRQGTVDQWQALRPIFEFCARENSCEGGGGGGQEEIVVTTGNLGGDLM